MSQCVKGGAHFIYLYVRYRTVIQFVKKECSLYLINLLKEL